jgi:hypothetical protein
MTDVFDMTCGPNMLDIQYISDRACIQRQLPDKQSRHYLTYLISRI